MLTTLRRGAIKILPLLKHLVDI